MKELWLQLFTYLIITPLTEYKLNKRKKTLCLSNKIISNAFNNLNWYLRICLNSRYIDIDLICEEICYGAQSATFKWSRVFSQ